MTASQTISDSTKDVFRVDEGRANGGDVTLFRREVKFALPDTDLGKLRSILEVNCHRITHRHKTSLVSSLYFDDARLSACHENIEGVSQRSKLRLRWYDGDERRLFLEVKRRREHVVAKERLPIEASLELGSLSFRDMLKGLCRILPPRLREHLIARPEPVLICQYRREYFKALDGPTRITLDRAITCYGQMSRRQPEKRFAKTIPDLVILEGKAPPGRELELRALLHPLAPTITKSSKYVIGCQLLGLLDGTPVPYL
jgi:hypothetical protein